MEEDRKKTENEGRQKQKIEINRKTEDKENKIKDKYNKMEEDRNKNE